MSLPLKNVHPKYIYIFKYILQSYTFDSLYGCMHVIGCLFMLFYVNICYALLFENKDKIKTICLLQTKQLSDKFCLLIKPKIAHPLHRERKFDIIWWKICKSQNNIWKELLTDIFPFCILFTEKCIKILYK